MMASAQPIGLYGWIKSNDGRSTGLFVAFLAAIQLIAPLALVAPLLLVDIDHAPFFGWGGYLVRYAPIVVIASIIWFAAHYWWHLETVKRAVGFVFVDDRDEPRLCRIIEPLIILTGLPVPFVGVIESPARNAFACGIGRRKAVVVVTRGLLDALNDDELASVLAHELSHIRNGDIRLMAAATIFMTALNRLHARNALRFTWVHALFSLAVPAVLPLSLAGGIVGRWALKAGQVSRLLIASSREFIADAEAAQWTQNPAALASALLKVEGHHRLENARSEDDAMMIAGETDGAGATHPTVAQRVAALARVTGSMVFNAPSAPRPGDWTRDTSPDAVSRVAFGRRAETLQAIAQVRQGDGEDMLGLDLFGRCAVVAAVLGLIGLHYADLDNPRALAATFDPRPMALLVSTPAACELSPFLSDFAQTCSHQTSAAAYRAFEGQHNTLAGYIAARSRERRPDDADDGSLSDLFHGSQPTGEGDEPSSTPMHGDEAQALPDAETVAMIDRAGCFPWHPLPFADGTPRSLTETAPGDHTIGSIVGDVDRLALDITVSSDSPKAYVEYLNRRMTLLGLTSDAYGQPGLAIVRSAFDRPMHVNAVARLRGMIGAVSRQPGMTPIERAELRALTRDSATFVPCQVHA